MLDIAATTSASVHDLTGSSQPGAVPPSSITTPLASELTCPHSNATTFGHADAGLIDLAERVKALARRDQSIWDRRTAIDTAVDRQFRFAPLPPKPVPAARGTFSEVELDGLRTTTIVTPTTPDLDYVAALAAYDAAIAERHRLEAQMEARLGYPRLEKLSKRAFARLVRWTEQLTLMRPETQEGMGAKAEVQGVLAETGNHGDWTKEFAAAVGRDAVRIATMLAGERASRRRAAGARAGVGGERGALRRHHGRPRRGHGSPSGVHHPGS